MTELDRLDARLSELETRLAFQDDLVGAMNRQVSDHAFALTALKRELEQLRDALGRPQPLSLFGRVDEE